MSNDSKQCWQCRLVSGGGLLCAGAYVAHHGKKLQGFQRFSVTSIGYGIGIVGVLRLLGLPPLRKKQIEKNLQDKKDDDEYIIGKFTSKFN